MVIKNCFYSRNCNNIISTCIELNFPIVNSLTGRI